MSKNLFTLLIAFIMCLASCSFVSKDFDTSDKDNLIIQLITYVLDQAHYLDKEINDEFSEKVFDTFLKKLDPYKRYFYASDIEEFSKYKFLKAFSIYQIVDLLLLHNLIPQSHIHIPHLY